MVTEVCHILPPKNDISKLYSCAETAELIRLIVRLTSSIMRSMQLYAESRMPEKKYVRVAGVARRLPFYSASQVYSLLTTTSEDFLLQDA